MLFFSCLCQLDYFSSLGNIFPLLGLIYILIFKLFTMLENLENHQIENSQSIIGGSMIVVDVIF